MTPSQLFIKGQKHP